LNTLNCSAVDKTTTTMNRAAVTG